MADTKLRRESKTLQGLIVSLISLVIGSGSQLVESQDVAVAVSSVFALIGIGYGIYGRITATKKLV